MCVCVEDDTVYHSTTQVYISCRHHSRSKSVSLRSIKKGSMTCLLPRNTVSRKRYLAISVLYLCVHFSYYNCIDTYGGPFNVYFTCFSQLRVREHPVLGPYVEDLSTFAANSYSDIEVPLCLFICPSVCLVACLSVCPFVA